MSDEEDYDEEENEEEEDEDEEDEEEEENDDDEDEDEEIDPETKKQLIESDLAILKDIFKYIDQTSKRITERIETQEAIQRLKHQDDWNERVYNPPSNKAQGPSMNNNISWSEYDKLNELERAELLERALTVLMSDEPSSRGRR